MTPEPELLNLDLIRPSLDLLLSYHSQASSLPTRPLYSTQGHQRRTSEGLCLPPLLLPQAGEEAETRPFRVLLAIE